METDTVDESCCKQKEGDTEEASVTQLNKR